MELEVANGSWRHGLILSVRCGDVRRQAPLSYDTRIAFPQEAVAQKQVQVDVFAKVGTDTITFDPQTELYDLNIGGDCEGFSGLSLRMKTQEEAAGGLRKRIENAQATEEYIEQHDLRQFATQVTPQVQLSQGQTPVRAQPVSAGGEGAVASPTTEDRLQMARQDAADYVERFDLRQVLQNMFQRVIRERPDDPFGFMQSFLSNGSIRPWAVASVEADAAEEEQRSRRDQERDEQLAAAQKQLEQQRARVDELLAGGAAGASAKGGGPAEPAYDPAAVAAQVEGHVQHIKALEEQLRESEARNANGPTAVEQAQRREDDHQHQLTLTRAQATAQAQRIQTLEQQLKEAKRAAERNQEIAEEAKRKAARGGSPDAEGAALEAAVHEAAAARDAAVARELAAAAAAVQEASTSRDAAVTRELATLQERTDLQRRCQGYEHNMKQLDKKLQALERKTGVTVTDKEAAAEPMRELPSPKQQEAPGAAEGQDLSQEERRFREAVRQYGELESKHRETNQRLADLERRCQEAEAQRSEAQEQLERLQDEAAVKAQAAAKAEEAAAAVGATRELEPLEPQEPQAVGEGASRELVPDADASASAKEEAADDPAREVKLLSERVEVERRCHEQALLECQELQRKNQQITRQKTELEAKLSEGDAASQSNLAKTGETCKMLERRIQELEANAANAAATAAAQQSELSRSYEMQLDNQKTRMDMLQRKIQAYEAFGVSGDDGAGGAAQQVSPRGDAAAGGSRGSANKVGLSTTGSLRPGIATASTMPPPTASTASAAPPLAVFGASGGSEVNTHMLSQLLASTYAPPVPPTTYVEQRDDRDVEPGPPDPELLVEVVDCKDVMSNGIFAWVGVCNLRPLYRLLGPEPRYLYYVEADIASHWRIVNKMGSEEYVERFRRPTDAKLPVECEKGDAGGGVFEVKLTPEIIQRISMINSHDEKVAIRTKLLDAYGQQFVSLEGKGRGLVSKASPVVAVAHALESQQRAIQLLHSQLSVETQRREAAEQHSTSMEQAFETLQLRIQAQLPGPPSVASLQEVQAAMGGQHARAFAEHAHGAYASGEHGEPGASQDRGLVFEKDGKADWAPDLGPGFGPVPHPPIEPKDRKPVPPPSFRRGPSGMRNSKGSPRPIAYPVAAGAPVPDWTLPPMPEEPAAAEPIAVE